MRRAAKWAGGFALSGALATGAFLAIGLLLPGRAEIVRSVEIDAPPEDVFPFLDDLELWLEWTPWSEIDSRVEGRASGAGAKRVWDDEKLGSGTLTIVSSTPPRRVAYRAEAANGRMRFDGVLEIREGNGGSAESTVVWTERADLGRNPLLGWTALTLEDSQGRQMSAGLERLKQRVERRSPEPARR